MGTFQGWKGSCCIAVLVHRKQGKVAEIKFIWQGFHLCKKLDVTFYCKIILENQIT